MTSLSDPAVVLRQRHHRAGAATIALLALTGIHHAYGALAFGTPWRLHIVAIAAPVAIAIVAALHYGTAMSSRRAGQLATGFATLLILLFPVAAIGIYEGGYNHVLKNLVYFMRGEADARALFPPPLYEMPRDVFFEATGIAQFPLSIMTAVRTLPLLRGAAGPTGRVARGQAVPVRHIRTLSGETIDLADGRRPTHVQFRRFAGCPVCNLHLRSFVRRRDALKAVVREVVVFHSRAEDIAAHAGELPFHLVADPGKALYRTFGVEAGARALLWPGAWPGILRAIAVGLSDFVLRRRPMPPLFPEGGRYGLPADVLVSPDGIVLAVHYGMHADDQWSVGTVLSLCRPPHAVPAARVPAGNQAGSAP
jgi:peroxiredoxin